MVKMFWRPFNRIILFFLSSPEDMLIDFRERREGKGRTERNTDVRDIDQLPDACTPAENWTCNLGMCPDWESNLWLLGLWNDAPTNWVTTARALFFFLTSPKDIFIDFRERDRWGGRERNWERRERERERDRPIDLHMCPNWRLNPQLRYVYWPGIEPTPFWCIGWYSNQLSHLARTMQ